MKYLLLMLLFNYSLSFAANRSPEYINIERTGLDDVCWKYGGRSFRGFKVDIAAINSIDNYYHFTFSLGLIREGTYSIKLDEGSHKAMADLLIQAAQARDMRVNICVDENSNSVVGAAIVRPSS